MLAPTVFQRTTDDEPTPLRRPTATLTPRGLAAVAVVRLERQLLDLDIADRSYVRELIVELLDQTIA